jgi:hypothetical protein
LRTRPELERASKSSDDLRLLLKVYMPAKGRPVRKGQKRLLTSMRIFLDDLMSGFILLAFPTSCAVRLINAGPNFYSYHSST